MPAWGMHMLIAKRINKKLKLDYNEFMIGNLIPDIYSGWIIEDVSKKIIYEISHYGKIVIVNGSKYMLPSYEDFLSKNSVKSNALLLGYLVHLLSDYFFNNYTFELKYIKNEKDEVVAIRNKNYKIITSNSNMAKATKQNDFKIYSEDLILKNRLKKICINDDIVNKVKQIKNMEILESDLKKVEIYVEAMIKKKKLKRLDEDSLEMFSKSELDNMINMCVDFIFVILKKESLI